MKLLFDQNLAPRLKFSMAEAFPGSIHVREVGLRDADDGVIWNHALHNDFAIATKDADFQRRALLYGAPPKVIWLRVGNCGSAVVETLLKSHAEQILIFGADAQRSLFVLSLPFDRAV